MIIYKHNKLLNHHTFSDGEYSITFQYSPILSKTANAHLWLIETQENYDYLSKNIAGFLTYQGPGIIGRITNPFSPVFVQKPHAQNLEDTLVKRIEKKFRTKWRFSTGTFFQNTNPEATKRLEILIHRMFADLCINNRDSEFAQNLFHRDNELLRKYIEANSRSN